MKVQITAGTLGGDPLRHLDAGQVLDWPVEDVAPLCRAGKARLLDPGDQAGLVDWLRRQDAAVRRLTDRGRP